MESLKSWKSFGRGHPCWIYCLVILVFCFRPAACPAHTELTPAEAHDKIQAGGHDVIVLDVRGYDEFCSAVQHIPDALNLPWGGGSGPLTLRYSELPTDRDIIVL